MALDDLPFALQPGLDRLIRRLRLGPAPVSSRSRLLIQGHVSFMPEVGAHAGPSPEERHTFIAAPPAVRPSGPITHPAQLYEHLVAYQGRA